MSGITQLGYRAEVVYHNFRNELIQGAYAPNSRLPSMDQLAKKHNVTYVTFRKAALRLADEGMLDIRNGSGIYVRKSEIKNRMSKVVSVMYMYDDKNITTIQREILKRGFSMGVYSQCSHSWDIKAERAFLRRVMEDRHQGLIAFCSPIKPGNDAVLREIEYNGTRVIHIEHFSMEPPEQEYILPDFRRAGRMAVTNLLIAGYSPIYALYQYANRKNRQPYLEMILDGVKSACEENIGGFDEKNMHLEMPTDVDIEKKMENLVKSLPDGAAVISTTGEYGTALLGELRRQKRSVPDQIGVISIDVMSSNTPSTDILSFNREKIILDAIDAVTSPESGKMRKLIMPVHVRKGTVRGSSGVRKF
ncbi:MAG: GntR family transcriptional regulator [Victivallales bacterium]|jgi:DNA-binding LacI/PurR family transcriptional regulator